MGNTHTKLRNRLKNQTVRDIAVVKLDIRRDHAQRGPAVRRVKRQFGEDPSAGDIDLSGRQIDIQETAAAFSDEEESEAETENEQEESGSVQHAREVGTGDGGTVSEQSFEAVRERLIQQVSEDDDTDSSIGTDFVVPASGNRPPRKVRSSNAPDPLNTPVSAYYVSHYSRFAYFFGAKTAIPLETMVCCTAENGRRAGFT